MRLAFALDDWTRLSWVSAEAKRVWTERLNNINEAWLRIERWAVIEGVRSSCLTFFDPQYLPEASKWAASHGLVLLPLAQVGVSDQYSATPRPPSDGRWQYRTVLTHQHLVRRWLEAWQDTGVRVDGPGGRYVGTNNRAIGELLGYPSCCIDFFERAWVGDGHLDTTWPMTINTTPNREMRDELTAVVDGPPEANILLRWLGVRLVSHLPCSHACRETVRRGLDFAAVGRKRHFGEWVDWIYEMLEWSVEWSALHGVAEIRTPILTISSRTDATAERHTVQRRGTRYPVEGAQGLRFPYRIVPNKLTAAPSFVRSVTPTWELNGFRTELAMVRAHDVILEAVEGRLAPKTRVLDLGCGTGALLQRFQDRGCTVTGVENDPVRAGAARISVRRGDVLDPNSWVGEWDIVLCMPGRLLEGMAEERAEAFRTALRTRARTVLFYAYGYWLTRYDGLAKMLVAAGVDGGVVLETTRGIGMAAQAMLVDLNQAPEGALALGRQKEGTDDGNQGEKDSDAGRVHQGQET